MDSGHLPLVRTHAHTDNSNLSIMMYKNYAEGRYYLAIILWLLYTKINSPGHGGSTCVRNGYSNCDVVQALRLPRQIDLDRLQPLPQ